MENYYECSPLIFGITTQGKEKEKPPPPKRKVAADEFSPKDVESKKKKVQEPVVIDLDTEESNQSQSGKSSSKAQPQRANMDFEPDSERQKKFVRKVREKTAASPTLLFLSLLPVSVSFF